MLKRIEGNKMYPQWKINLLKWAGAGVVLFALLALSAVVLNNVVATPISPRDAQIRGWVNDLREEGLSSTRQSAQDQLEAAGEEAVPTLVTALHSNDVNLRRNAADVLGYIASPRAADALKESLGSDPVPAVRANAAWALGEIKSAAAYGALENASVADTSQQVRDMANESVSNINNDLAQRAGVAADKVNAIAVAPSTPDTVYLATARDLKISRNGGAQWETLSQTLPSLASALSVNPTNPEILYAGMHSQGMFLSTDGGKTWESLTRNFSNQAIGESTVTAIAVDPSNPMRVVMAHGIRIGDTGDTFFPLGILSSNDGGKSWGYVLDLAEGQLVTRMSIKDNKVYALSGEHILIAPLAQ